MAAHQSEQREEDFVLHESEELIYIWSTRQGSLVLTKPGNKPDFFSQIKIANFLKSKHI